MTRPGVWEVTPVGFESPLRHQHFLTFLDSIRWSHATGSRPPISRLYADDFSRPVRDRLPLVGSVAQLKRKVHAAHQVLEARVIAQRVEVRPGINSRQIRIALDERSLQPIERRLVLTGANV